MKKPYEAPVVSRRGKLAEATAKIDPKISGITIRIPEIE